MFLILIQLSLSAVVGIDLGSDTIKVSVGSRTLPVHFVRNSYNHELTPNRFYYQDKRHWGFGESAVDQCMLHPDKCVTSLPLNKNYYFGTLKGYEITALSLLQILQDVKNSENIPDDELKVVIAIPPSMTNREKSYLYSAFTAAGILCIQFVTTTFAPIELYVAEKRYSTFSHSVAFIDIGHSGVRVSGFDFNNEKIIQSFGEFNDNFGGKTIDENLLKIVTKRYRLKIDNEKSRLHLLSDIKKAKETLTVQPKATFTFRDKSISLTRTDVENSCQEITRELTTMIKHLRQKMKIDTFQLLGGCSRIPYLQNFIDRNLNIRAHKHLDVNSAVSMGACYGAFNEIPSRIKTREALLTFETILRCNGNIYKIFTYNSKDNSNPVVSVRTNENHLLSLVETSDADFEFSKFSLQTYSYIYPIELGFTVNYYLMPVPDAPLINGVEGTTLFERIGWEVEPNELQKSKDLIYDLISNINQRLRNEKKANTIEEYKLKVQNKLKKYGIFNWRHLALSGIYMYIDYQYNQCLDEGECNDRKVNDILRQFKQLVKYIVKEDEEDENVEQKFTGYSSASRKKSIEKLYNMLEVCKVAGTQTDDIERWIAQNLRTATEEEIIENIGVLKERGRRAQNRYYHDL
ncbi:dnaK protein [Tritrichomonas foetus]|uniref:DnaK protein n=1 Tax=Tritrichomonas foetus TaxID=1144522 RepID=A0A1J4KS67_9EUKA|nr:dnaK protein [Tritrichomonas foetus]|eukprot:OHT12510.1 dnaK protein [Tritrichomonas foetus]